MNMTREEAIKWLEETIQDTDTYWESCSEALQKELDEQKEVFLLALSALRPVSRERVEKAWRGEWKYVEDAPLYADDGSYTCSMCGEELVFIEGTPLENNMIFCPACGAAMTDEAVEMVMERMEKLHEDNGCS